MAVALKNSAVEGFAARVQGNCIVLVLGDPRKHKEPRAVCAPASIGRLVIDGDRDTQRNIQSSARRRNNDQVRTSRVSNKQIRVFYLVVLE